MASALEEGPAVRSQSRLSLNFPSFAHDIARCSDNSCNGLPWLSCGSLCDTVLAYEPGLILNGFAKYHLPRRRGYNNGIWARFLDSHQRTANRAAVRAHVVQQQNATALP